MVAGCCVPHACPHALAKRGRRNILVIQSYPAVTLHTYAPTAADATFPDVEPSLHGKASEQTAQLSCSFGRKQQQRYSMRSLRTHSPSALSLSLSPPLLVCCCSPSFVSENAQEQTPRLCLYCHSPRFASLLLFGPHGFVLSSISACCCGEHLPARGKTSLERRHGISLVLSR